MTSARTQQWSRPKTPPLALSASPPPIDPRKPYICSCCGVGFAREKALETHSRVHGSHSQLQCYACGKLCWSREALASHVRLRHPGLPKSPFKRQLTVAENDSGAKLEFSLAPIQQGCTTDTNIYEKITTPGAKQQCRECGVVFQRADLLKKHLHITHGYVINNTDENSSPQFPCKECGEVFKSRSSQQDHARIHKVEPDTCRFCWKTFPDGVSLMKHERTHTVKPYACAVCSRTFSRRGVLQKHLWIYHAAPAWIANDSPAFVCTVCGQTLPTSTELVHHLVQHCTANSAKQKQSQLDLDHPPPHPDDDLHAMQPHLSPSPPLPPSPSPQSSPSPQPSLSPLFVPVPEMQVIVKNELKEE